MLHSDTETIEPQYDPPGSVGITENAKWWDVISRLQGMELPILGIIIITVSGNPLEIVLAGNIPLAVIAIFQIYMESRNGKTIEKDAENTPEFRIDGSNQGPIGAFA